MSRGSTSNHLIDFFDPAATGSDPRGRKLVEILEWPDRDLEYSHNYIQNLFPLPEGSAFNHAIWIVSKEDYDAFRQRPELRSSFTSAFDRICAFYGLKCEPSPDSNGALRVVRAQNFDEAKDVWLSRFNHNHLRITRILRSLRVLSLSEQAAAYHSFLQTDPEVIAKVSSTSQMYWKRAAERSLRLPPDEDDDDAEGIEWLRNKS